jgi:hypothetical protein
LLCGCTLDQSTDREDFDYFVIFVFEISDNLHYKYWPAAGCDTIVLTCT